MSKEKTGGVKFPFKLPIFKNLRKAEEPAGQAQSAPKSQPRLKLVFFIVDWSKTEIISNVFEEEKVRYHFISKATGTARTEILDLLGIGTSEKALVLCLEQEVLVPVLLKEVRKKLGFHNPGAGIAFTVPLSGINTPLLRVFKESILKNEKITAENSRAENFRPEQEGGAAMAAEPKTEITNDLIIAIINHGYSEEFMTTAREAGATGGTVLNARGLSHEGPVKFFGVSVQDEKEIIIILSNREKKVPIMQAVSKACGLTSKAEGLVFSLPVDSVLGLSFE
jgi:nitrogen regulatory protein PII